MHLYFSTTLEDFIFENNLSLEYLIKFFINSLWQVFWDFEDTNKVNKPCNYGLKRQDEVNISRLRIGHSKFTHSYLLNGEEWLCDCQLTIQHILFTYVATPQQKNSFPGSHEIYNFSIPFLSHHYYILVYRAPE